MARPPDPEASPGAWTHADAAKAIAQWPRHSDAGPVWDAAGEPLLDLPCMALVGVLLCRAWRTRGGLVDSTPLQMAADMRCDRRTAQRAIGKLERLGVLQRLAAKGGRGCKSRWIFQPHALTLERTPGLGKAPTGANGEPLTTPAIRAAESRSLRKLQAAKRAAESPRKGGRESTKGRQRVHERAAESRTLQGPQVLPSPPQGGGGGESERLRHAANPPASDRNASPATVPASPPLAAIPRIPTDAERRRNARELFAGARARGLLSTVQAAYALHVLPDQEDPYGWAEKAVASGSKFEVPTKWAAEWQRKARREGDEARARLEATVAAMATTPNPAHTR